MTIPEAATCGHPPCAPGPEERSPPRRSRLQPRQAAHIAPAAAATHLALQARHGRQRVHNQRVGDAARGPSGRQLRRVKEAGVQEGNVDRAHGAPDRAVLPSHAARRVSPHRVGSCLSSVGCAGGCRRVLGVRGCVGRCCCPRGSRSPSFKRSLFLNRSLFLTGCVGAACECDAG